MKILELFAGTGSVGKVARAQGHTVVSLDLKDADINTDIMLWDYKKAYEPNHFDMIWASPPCNTFSNLRRSWIGRKTKYFGDRVITKEMLDEDMMNVGLPILRKTLEIIEYYDPIFLGA
jgi:site-specific DNA-cytosine methylase